MELWNDSGIGNFALFYVRTKDKKETDFLITSDNIPWCFFEVKIKDRPIAAHHYKHSQALGNIPVVQLTRENNILKKAKAYSIVFQPAGFVLNLRRTAPHRGR